jgi:hypothetical protein
MWIVQSFEQYFKLFLISHCGTLFQHEYSRTKSKGTIGYSIRFDYFSVQISGNSDKDEENIDYLCCVHDNIDYMYFHYIYRHIRRCERTLEQSGTRHDINSSFIFVHECYVDIFILQVSDNTGCNKCSIKNVIKLMPNILQKLWLERNSVFSRYPLLILRLRAPNSNGQMVLCIIYRIHEHHVSQVNTSYTTF